MVKLDYWLLEMLLRFSGGTEATNAKDLLWRDRFAKADDVQLTPGASSSAFALFSPQLL